MPQRREAQASLVSLALYSAIIIAGVSTVVVLGRPILEDMQDAEAVDTAAQILSNLDEQVRRIAEGGKGSRIEAGLRFSQGRFEISSEDDSITYELKTDARFISPHTTRQIGNLRLSALSGVEVRKAEVNGQECWMMENEHIQACIRAVAADAQDEVGNATLGFWRFNTAGGTTVRDNSSYGNDGSLNGPLWREGLRETGLEFDGSDSVTVSDSDSLDLEGGFTLTAWVNWSGSGTGKVLRKGGSYGLWTNSTHAVFELDGKNVSTALGEGWNYIAGRYNGSHQSVSVGGEKEETVSNSGSGPS
ncbi:MAG: LamG-like jellyroll fold domain-containing protein, partial [Candidatus Nanohaloarchaea archaeon]|nr:LamG-like jellyroll fold domain-containing protein [Candidatus Nanohaloarchaea archaeon]